MARPLFTETVLVTNATRYEVEGNRGTSIQYLSADYAEGPNRRGSQPVDASCSFELFDELPVLPGIYKLHFGRGNGVRTGSGKSKATVEPVGAEYIEPLDLELLLDHDTAKAS